MNRHLAIFGASGDLTTRYLFPALAHLHEQQRLPDDFRVTALGRGEMSPEEYRGSVGEWLAGYAGDVSEESRSRVAALTGYRQASVTDSGELGEALGPPEEPVTVYLALPPAVFAPAIEALSGAGLPEGSRVVVEKPFGESLESARELNRLLRGSFAENEVFRVDHFLALQTVQNVLGTRFANRVFEPVWNHQHVERVEVVWDETLALEGRAEYYDSAGALKDMVQSHLLQLLCLVGMEPPLSLGERDFRNRKAEVLRAVRRLSPEEVERQTVRARYTSGSIGGEEVPAYAGEEGVDPDRETETFVRVTLHVENWRWAGVPFVLRTGKALGEDRGEIAVHFRPVPHLSFGQSRDPQPNVLRLQLGPDRLTLSVSVNGPGEGFAPEEVDLGSELAPQELPAYGRLLLAVLEGDPTLSIRGDEAEESWRIVEPILEAWGEGRVPLREYPAGSEGPEPR